MTGTLYLVGVPIGNLGDMTPRALEILRAVDLVAAEDTRTTRGLLTRFGLKVRLESYHKHNRREKGDKLRDLLLEGLSVALVADAGTPGISDPGSDLVQLCADAGIPVVVVPGACAAIAGLTGSGLCTDRFVFEGFLPATGRMRRTALEQVASETRTVILYEAPHRVRRTLSDLTTAGLGDRRIVAARELTKLHEEFLRGTVEGLAVRYAEDDPRGEYVLILEGREAYEARVRPADDGEETARAEKTARERIAVLVADGVPVKEIARRVSQETGMPRKEVYAIAAALREDRPESGFNRI